MEHISITLFKALNKRGLYDHANASLILHLAQNWIDTNLEEFKDELTVVSYRDKKLSIQSDNSIAAQECNGSLDSLKEFLTIEHKHNVDEIRIVRTS
ncbi:hypothetical protein KJ652_03795 [Patescibacteria group bacterium]|nr:hypothetical protein [Patescibacteria group bacterium]MBU1123688.1 hypothetical protein [Patescibacteria group bacterium]MBU1910820.1 hypothetical protein [Patescibacteria group bacterium]